MYKIYNNEIKILQLIKGGSDLIPEEDKVYNKDGSIYKYYNSGNDASINVDLSNPLKFDEDTNFNLVPPFFDVPIIFKDFNEEMLKAIICTLLIFKPYMSDGKVITNLDEKQKIQLLELAIGNFKEIGLFDHYKNKFIEFNTFVDSIVSKEYLSGGSDNQNIVIGKQEPVNVQKVSLEEAGKEQRQKVEEVTYESSSKEAAKYFKCTVLFKEKKTCPTQDVLNGGDINNLRTFFDSNPYSLEEFYIDYKNLYEANKGSIDCDKIYFRQKFKDTSSPFQLNGRFLIPVQGGNYDQLDYMLNGGSLNTIVRIPNLSNYFKKQLKLIENKLRAYNKVLSENSRRDINQIIDSLDKHENNLRKQFELLKSAYLINEGTINVKEHQKKIEEAKKSLSKHKRYAGSFGDLINTLEKIANKYEEDKEKPLDKFLKQ